MDDMDDKQQETKKPIIIDGFTDTLLPFFSWFLSQFLSGMLGCKLTSVLLHPTATYRNLIADTWVKNNQLFSPAEVLSFDRASGRRRGRKKLKKLFGPFFREMKRSPECLLFKHRFQEKWNKLREAVSDEIPLEIPPKARIEIDIAKLEKRMDEQLTAYSRDDILEAFPKGSTLTKRELKKRVASEVDSYPQTMYSLLWEASRDWNLIRQIGIREDSKLWEILRFDSNDEPRLERLINWALCFGLGQANEDELLYLTRWFMDRIVVSQFIPYPYSDKRFDSLGKSIADDLTLEDAVADNRAQEPFYRIEDLDTLSNALHELPAAQRDAAELFLQAESPQALRQKLGDKKYRAIERNFERALKKLRESRQTS